MNPTIALILALVGSYAATAEEAAKTAVYAANGSHVQIEQTNIVGRCATVLMRNAMREGSLDHAPILLQRFSFGWQPLESLGSRCDLDVHGISPHDRFVLMRKMPALQDDRPCKTDGRRDSARRRRSNRSENACKARSCRL